MPKRLHRRWRRRRSNESTESDDVEAIEEINPAKAIHYALERGAELLVFVDDGRVGMYNNAFELVLRTVAVGRKNYLSLDRIRAVNGQLRSIVCSFRRS